MLGIDEGGDAARALHVRDRVEGQRRLTGRLRTVDLDDAATGQATDAEGDVEGDGTGRNDLDGSAVVAAQSHDRALSELAVDLGEGRFEGLLAVGG